MSESLKKAMESSNIFARDPQQKKAHITPRYKLCPKMTRANLDPLKTAVAINKQARPVHPSRWADSEKLEWKEIIHGYYLSRIIFLKKGTPQKKKQGCLAKSPFMCWDIKDRKSNKICAYTRVNTSTLLTNSKRWRKLKKSRKDMPKKWKKSLKKKEGLVKSWER